MRAIVLAQPLDARAGIVVAKALDIGRRGATEAVDRLIGVAHRPQRAGLAGQCAQKDAHRAVNVLKLVHQHMRTLRALLGQHIWLLAQQTHRLADDIAEVCVATLVKRRLVCGVDTRDLA